MARWKGHEGRMRLYHKKIRFYNTDTERTYKTTLYINLSNPGDDGPLVKSFVIGEDRLNVWWIPGEKYHAGIVGKNTSRPMKNEDIRHFFLNTIMPELENFPNAKIKGDVPSVKPKREYLTDLRDEIKENLEMYQEDAIKRIGSDWKKYNEMPSTKRMKEEEKA
jgi:hypothetical protein